ncbi:ComEC/Rec2 family competence protein [Spiroplasma sp. AdecLV25b]|uniref:ComEC/Rec2 family competence protein n=1 Tax=Spiroplasma sp. AdecLV25b TaxID=3027162 RepID=UPI0027E11067|nr:ComEC/Rec2 family competence protein [Spiroplasma sp. AdecLV25b]
MFSYHIVLIGFLIFLLYFFSSFSIFSGVMLLSFFILILYFLFIKKQIWHKFALLMLVFVGIFTVNASLPTHNYVREQTINLKVSSIHTNYLFVKSGYETYYLATHYYLNNQQYTIDSHLDDTLVVYGKTIPLKAINNFYEFDFKLFLNVSNITQQIMITKNQIHVISGHSIRSMIFNYVNTFPNEIKTWTNLLLFGQQNTDSKLVYNSFIKLGIAPLIVVSGLHINFLFMILNKTLTIIKIRILKICLIFTCLLFYAYLLNWTIPVIRAIIFCFIGLLAKFSKQTIHPLSSLSFTTFCCLCWQPFQFYTVRFQLSFGISFLILFIIHKFKTYNKYWKSLFISTVLYLFTIPFQWQMNQGFSLFTIIYSLLLTPVILFYDIVLLLNLIFNPISSFVVKPSLYILNIIVDVTTITNVWITTFQVDTWVLQLYYLVLGLCFTCFRYFNWRIITILAINCTMISGLWVANTIKPFYELTMINVGNAMSIIITSPYNKSAIMIDAGTQDLNPNNPTIGNYLAAKGVTHINALFLTHHDLDHVSNVQYLENHFQIDNIYENTNQRLQYKIANFNDINNLSYNLNTKYASENNKSLVLLLQIYQFKILITGDIEASTENLLINSGLLTKINILQVPHHGSKTSSTINFTNY